MKDDEQFVVMMASMAMQGLISTEWGMQATEAQIAFAAFEQADALLAERNKRRAAAAVAAALKESGDE